MEENINNENIYDKIREIFGKLPENFNVLEEKIDVDLQMEYFDFSSKHKEKLDKDEIVLKKDLLFDENASIFQKKVLLVQLASVDDVGAYRALEKYSKEPDLALKDWAVLSLQESRMVLQSELLDENQVFISTGLGGKGNLLRYHVILLYSMEEMANETQEKIVKNEFSFVLKKFHAELEKINFLEHYASLLLLIPLNIPVNEVIQRAIKDCNEFGDFLQSNFIVTNVKELSHQEIQDYIRRENNKLKGD